MIVNEEVAKKKECCEDREKWCSASMCMAWEWLDDENRKKSFRRGCCGKAQEKLLRLSRSRQA